MSHAAKYVSAEEAARCVKSGDWVDYGFCLGHPVVMDEALAARKDELHDVKIRGGIVLRPLRVIEDDPTCEHFTFHSWHMGGYERKMSDAGRCCYIPLIYRHMPQYYRKSLRVDVAVFTVSPMDSNGFFSFGLTNGAARAIVERATIVILEVNANMPAIRAGAEQSVHISEVDYVVESGNPPLPTLAAAEPSELDRRVAEHVIKELCDGAVIQLGIGAVPNAIGTMIAGSDLKHLGAHTEMLVDAYRIMIEAGKITNLRKTFNRGHSVFTFAAGSADLYDWARDNAGLAMFPVDYCNNPDVMARHEAMMTINSCIEVDLTGQVNSESSGHRQISGTGGQVDFSAGGYLSPRGKSFICCHSVYTDRKTGQRQSRIVPALSPGTVVTTGRGFVHKFVTEWGVVDLAGCSLWERAEKLISIAHPDFRDQLQAEAEERGILRKR